MADAEMLRYATRALLKSPAFSGAVIVILAITIGATSGTFSAVHAILLTPLPISEPSRLVVGWETDAKASGPVELSYKDFQDWQAGSQSFASFAGVGSSNWPMVLDGRGDPVQLPVTGVTASFFETLGARPFLGRTFKPSDDVPNAARVIVLNHDTWVRRFGADPTVVGQRVVLDDKLYTVVGVMPKGFDFPRKTELWTPATPILADSGALNDAIGVLYGVGRLRDDVTPAAASAELTRLVRSVRAKEPTGNLGSGAVVTPFIDYFFGPVRPALWLLFAAVAVLLLIACANVSALLLARASLRRREQAIQLALGASRFTLARTWILEALMLSTAGGLLGLFACRVFATAIVRLAPDDIPHIADVSINPSVIAFTCLAVFITAVGCGIAPVRHAGAVELREALSDAAYGTPGRQARRSRSLLLMLQMAFAVVLLVSAGLVVRSFVKLRTLDLGFSASGVLVMDVTSRSAGSSGNEWMQQLLARVRTFPGVEAAGAVHLPPLAFGPVGSGTWFQYEGQPRTVEATAGNPILNYQVATPDYFHAMRIALKQGRLFDARDDARSTKVVILGESTAKRLWPRENAIGKLIGMPTFADGPAQVAWRTVVGVVADVRYLGLDDVSSLDVYDPAAQALYTASNLVVRTAGNPLSIASAVEAAARALDTRVVIDRVTTLESVVSRTVAPWRLSAWMFGVFATLAAFLAAVGLFSLVSLDVASREKEFAVRMAFGAVRRDIVRHVFSAAAWHVLVGVGSGFAIAVLSTRALQRLLFGVEPLDGVTYACVIVLVLAVVAIASYVPARRAAGLDPSVLLRRG